MDTMKDKKNVKVLKDKLQTRQVIIGVEVVIIRENQVVEEIILLKEIKRNRTTKQEVQKELEKDKEQAWCQAQLALEDKSLQSWLGHAQSLETPAMSLVMQTCQNNLGLNLCVEGSKACHH